MAEREAVDETERQLARAQALSEYVLRCPSFATPAEILSGATDLLASQFDVDDAHAVRLSLTEDAATVLTPTGELALGPVGRELPTLGHPRLLPDGDLEPQDEPLLRALQQLEDRSAPLRSRRITQAVLMPVLGADAVEWLLVLVCFEGRASSRTQEAPGPHHVQFLQLVSGHVERLLDNARLAHDLRHHADELAESNQRLQSSLDELARAQQQLVQASKMEALGRLAGGIAHDFNNLLTVILSTADLMQQDMEPHALAARDLATLIEAAQRASALTRQLLTFGRRRPGKAQHLELHPLLSDMSRLLRRLIGEDVTLELRLEARYDALEADPAQIEQVVMNLVLNAREAMPWGGTVVVETSLGRPEGAPGGPPMIMLAVSDTGMGMDAATRARVFEPFFTTKASQGGSGMGLATVYGIVRHLGGQVQVHSQPGQGARFEVFLPRTGFVNLETIDGEPAAPRITVLVVEDEPAIRRLVSRILGRRGYEVLAAPDGETGLRRFSEREDDIDLVLTDIVMPGLDGVGMAQELRTRRPGLPVLFMSGYPGDNRPGMDDDDLDCLIDKPFTPDQLLERIEQVLRPPTGASAAKRQS
ncbi:hybrid sensor histidine kinase/response regulator [Paraliomyxa miuraensis]|uniref:hybrid sensor histidine kinase/response regulator n=1 Tax=Paraliomyxa miuraensis TaxID=376150 RepID=UPI00224DC269|nr:ATP-binding protein [Paraliomyxa miuraensis]MCX4246039.1 response regulator [Paraliomyxa miuraensis]